MATSQIPGWQVDFYDMEKLKVWIFIFALIFAQNLRAHPPLGAGLRLGLSSGINANYMVDNQSSIMGAFYFDWDENQDYFLQAMYLWHNSFFKSPSNLSTRWYFGTGLNVRFYNGNGFGDNDEVRYGPRASIGIIFPLTTTINLYGEVGSALNIAPGLLFEQDAGAGFRIYFDL